MCMQRNTIHLTLAQTYTSYIKLNKLELECMLNHSALCYQLTIWTPIIPLYNNTLSQQGPKCVRSSSTQPELASTAVAHSTRLSLQ
jgi:hypothetical protein